MGEGWVGGGGWEKSPLFPLQHSAADPPPSHLQDSRKPERPRQTQNSHKAPDQPLLALVLFKMSLSEALTEIWCWPLAETSRAELTEVCMTLPWKWKARVVCAALVYRPMRWEKSVLFFGVKGGHLLFFCQTTTACCISYVSFWSPSSAFIHPYLAILPQNLQSFLANLFIS